MGGTSSNLGGEEVTFVVTELLEGTSSNLGVEEVTFVVTELLEGTSSNLFWSTSFSSLCFLIRSLIKVFDSSSWASSWSIYLASFELDAVLY